MPVSNASKKQWHGVSPSQTAFGIRKLRLSRVRARIGCEFLHKVSQVSHCQQGTANAQVGSCVAAGRRDITHLHAHDGVIDGSLELAQLFQVQQPQNTGRLVYFSICNNKRRRLLSPNTTLVRDWQLSPDILAHLLALGLGGFKARPECQLMARASTMCGEPKRYILHAEIAAA